MKKLILIASVFLSTMFCANAGSGFIPCKSISFSGEESVCVGESAGYSMGDRGTHGVSWTVTNGAEILTASNIDMNKLRNAMGIPADAKIIYLHANNKLFDVSFDFGITATAQYSTGNVFSYNITGSSALGIRKNPTGESAKDIQVKFNTLGSSYVGVNVAGVGNRGECADNKGVNVSVTGADLDKFTALTLSGAQANNIGCSQYVTFATPWFPTNGSTIYKWTVSPNTANIVGSTTNNQLQISSFNNPGSYTVSLTVTSCGGKSKTVSKNVSVGTPNPDLRVNNSIFTDLEFKPSCTDANNGFNLSSEPWLSNSALYTWTLPAGWIISGQTPSSTKIDPDGAPIYTYQGVNLRYPRILQSHPAAKSGDIIMKVNNFCGSSYSVSKVMKIVAPLQLSVLLSSNNVTCDNSLTLNPIVTGGINGNSYKVQWSTTGVVGKFLKGNTFNTTTDYSNTFLAEQYGNGTARVYISGNDGCAGTAIANISMYGGNIATDSYISGWLSGHINPDQKAEVVSKPTPVENKDRVYFIRKISGLNQIWFYEFNNGKWILKNSEIQDVAQQSNLDIKYIKTTGANDVLFYMNKDFVLSAIQIENSSGKAVGVSTPVHGVTPKLDEFAYTITPFDGHNLEVVWKDKATAILYYGVLNYDIKSTGEINVALLNNQKLTISEPTVFLESATRFDHDKINSRVVYIKGDGGLYFRKINATLGILEPEIKINGVFPNDLVRNLTDIVYENGGNGIYFVAGGDIYYAEFDEITGNFLAIYKIQTTVGVQIPKDYTSGANGYLAKNPDPVSKSLYYIGLNGSIYQLVKRNDFTTSKSFDVVKSTPTTFEDNAESGLVFHRNHLFYRSSSSSKDPNFSSQMFNLFYIDIPGVVHCLPKYLRESANSSDFETVEAKLLAANTNELQGTVYPNPTSETITVNVWADDKQEGVIEIFNIQGLKISEEKYYFEPTILNISELEAGMYLIKVRANHIQKPISFKVIKQ